MVSFIDVSEHIYFTLTYSKPNGYTLPFTYTIYYFIYDSSRFCLTDHILLTRIIQDLEVGLIG